MVVNRRAVARLRAGHVWVYRSDVARAEAPAGALVRVSDERGKLLGTAFYSDASQIAVRLVHRGPVAAEELPALLRGRIAAAVEYRKNLVRDTDSWRVIFSEADALPGLVADKFNEIVSLQVLTQAWDAPELKQLAVTSLQELLQPASVVERVDARIRELEKLPAGESRALAGNKTETVFSLNGVRFHYDAVSGQKTGAFLDQRENYAAAERYARGRALDVCTYQGGFALHLARACESVTAVDISRAALEVAEQNEQLHLAEHKSGEIEWIEANAFDLLKDYSDAGEKYDTIVLDPPAFAKSKRAVETALRGYKELNLRALKMLRSGGVLVTCSCSHHVSESEFIDVVASAAADAHRRVRLLEKRGAAQDHPQDLNIPETSYLKCLILAVE